MNVVYNNYHVNDFNLILIKPSVDFIQNMIYKKIDKTDKN